MRDIFRNVVFSPNTFDAVTSTSMEQPLDGGNIQIHAKSSNETEEKKTTPGKNKSATIATGIADQPAIQATHFEVYPNPFTDRLKIEFASPEDARARIDIYDMTGRLVETVFNKAVKAGELHQAAFEPDDEVSSFYIYRMTLGNSVRNGKVIYRK